VTLVWTGGSFGTIAFLLVMASLAEPSMVLRDLAAAAVGTLVISGILVIALGASGGRPRSIEFYGYVMSFPVLHVALALSVATASPRSTLDATVALSFLLEMIHRVVEFAPIRRMDAVAEEGEILVLRRTSRGWLPRHRPQRLRDDELLCSDIGRSSR
jgi:hypothetical protein